MRREVGDWMRCKHLVLQVMSILSTMHKMFIGRVRNAANAQTMLHKSARGSIVS